MPFAPSMACPTRCRSAPFVALLAVPWRRILSYASLPCRRNGLRAWRPARLLRGDVWLRIFFVFLLCVISSAWPFLVRLTFVFLGRQCYANVLAKAHFVGGGVRARVSRRDLREHPGAHHEKRARLGLTPFSHTYMRLISGVRAALFSNLLGEHPQW